MLFGAFLSSRQQLINQCTRQRTSDGWGRMTLAAVMSFEKYLVDGNAEPCRAAAELGAEEDKLQDADDKLRVCRDQRDLMPCLKDHSRFADVTSGQVCPDRFANQVPPERKYDSNPGFPACPSARKDLVEVGLIPFFSSAYYSAPFARRALLSFGHSSLIVSRTG
ncbi:hypothetical protein LZ30DRAFT_247528 [Colletotrichum cereale]|nr:hypothetical protein LZ30DRAFT_247528 [Colletotrichum cereale]